MIRRCDGTDPNLITYPHDTDPGACPNPSPGSLHLRAVCRCDPVPCTCGKVFDDVHRMTIHPHQPV